MTVMIKVSINSALNNVSVLRGFPAEDNFMPSKKIQCLSNACICKEIKSRNAVRYLLLREKFYERKVG